MGKVVSVTIICYSHNHLIHSHLHNYSNNQRSSWASFILYARTKLIKLLKQFVRMNEAGS